MWQYHPMKSWMGPIKQKKEKFSNSFLFQHIMKKIKLMVMCLWSPITTYGTWARGSDCRVGPIWPYSEIVLKSFKKILLPDIFEVNWIHGYDVHEAVYHNWSESGFYVLQKKIEQLNALFGDSCSWRCDIAKKY